MRAAAAAAAAALGHVTIDHVVILQAL